MIPIRVFDGQQVAVFGLGASGVAAARALAAGGADVSAWDDSADARKAAQSQGIALVDLAKADWSAFACLVLAPGVPLSHPEPHWSVKRAREAAIAVIGDTELFFLEHAASGSKARTIGITGTNGKSTTSALVDHLLAFSRHKSLLGGNIGTAILDLDPFVDAMTYVIEFSSYQLDLTPSLALTGAVLLNITPDHLDRHGDFESYAAIKAGIFEHLDDDGWAVVGIDDEPSRKVADTLTGPYDVSRISTKTSVETGVFVRDGELVEMRAGRECARLQLGAIASLRGEHNWQNAAAAYAAARACGLSADDIAAGFASFPGLAHRMEPVALKGNIHFINDSKATNSEAVAKALACFDDIYWIAGGRAKDDGLAGLEQFYGKIRRAYLIGEAADAFAAELEGKVPCKTSRTLEKAVAAAASDAAAEGAENPVVLLSPACVSFDQFANFAERGNAFRAAVSLLGNTADEAG